MRLSGAHDFSPAMEPAAWEAFVGDPSDAAHERLQFYARAYPPEAAMLAASQARCFSLVRTREWYRSAKPDDVAQAFREAVALSDPGAGPALAHLSSMVVVRPALRDAVLHEFPTSVAARVLRSALAGPPPPPVALARLVAAGFPGGVASGPPRRGLAMTMGRPARQACAGPGQGLHATPPGASGGMEL